MWVIQIPNNYFVEKRRQDKQNLLRMFRENADVDENKIIALFSFKVGLRTETIRQMVEELKEAGLL